MAGGPQAGSHSDGPCTDTAAEDGGEQRMENTPRDILLPLELVVVGFTGATRGFLGTVARAPKLLPWGVAKMNNDESRPLS